MSESAIRVLLFISLFSTFILPSFSIVKGWPAFEISDLSFIPLVVIVLVFQPKVLIDFVKEHSAWLKYGLLFIALIVFSICWNGRYSSLRDWFEPMKFFKFLFFLIAIASFFRFEELKKLMYFLLTCTIVFNVLHYFNVFGFNESIEPFYAAPHHLDFFGLNSIGEPATKRAIGTMGNPNNNAFMFLGLLVFFLPRNGAQLSRLTVISNSIAILGMFMCQSRTALIAYIFLLLFYFLLVKPDKKWITYLLLYSVLVYTLLYLFGNSYLGSLGDMSLIQKAGVGRIEQWQRIVQSMPGYWWFGHGPDKAYFELNGIYAESEYFLILFRYGFIGLISFLIFILSFFLHFWQNRALSLSFFIPLLIIYTLTAITNTPFHSSKLLIVLSLLMASGIIAAKNAEKV